MTDLDALKAELDQLAAIDPTPENRAMIAGLIASIRGRVDNVLSSTGRRVPRYDLEFVELVEEGR